MIYIILSNIVQQGYNNLLVDIVTIISLEICKEVKVSMTYKKEHILIRWVW